MKECHFSVIGCKAENYPQKGYFEKDKKSNFFNSAALNILLTNGKIRFLLKIQK